MAPTVGMTSEDTLKSKMKAHLKLYANCELDYNEL